MKAPVLQDDALLADIESAKSDRPNFRLWWLGQSGFLVQFNGRHALRKFEERFTKQQMNEMWLRISGIDLRGGAK